jgi:hypothetical protein
MFAFPASENHFVFLVFSLLLLMYKEMGLFFLSIQWGFEISSLALYLGIIKQGKNCLSVSE